MFFCLTGHGRLGHIEFYPGALPVRVQSKSIQSNKKVKNQSVKNYILAQSKIIGVLLLFLLLSI